jgi:glutaredoxin 3
MNQVIIYTKTYCPYSKRAKELLRSKGIDFEEIDIARAPERALEMARATGLTTVPQILIDGRHIGGSDSLRRMDRTGELEGMGEGAPGH